MARGCLQFTHSGSQTMMHPKIPPRSTRARCPVVEEARAQHPSDWAAILAIAPKIGCNPETLRAWYREHQDMQNPTLVAKQAQDARIKARRSAYLSLKRNLDYLFTFEAPSELGMANLQFKCNSYKKDIHKRYCKKHQNIAGDRKWMPTVILRPLSGVA